MEIWRAGNVEKNTDAPILDLLAVCTAVLCRSIAMLGKSVHNMRSALQICTALRQRCQRPWQCQVAAVAQCVTA
jgi:hypothetical protein